MGTCESEGSVAGGWGSQRAKYSATLVRLELKSGTGDFDGRVLGNGHLTGAPRPVMPSLLVLGM